MTAAAARPVTLRPRDSIVFDVPVELVASAIGGPRLRGVAVQGPASGRFLYVTSGTRAGDLRSPWNRRAKVPLAPMPEALVRGDGAGGAVIVEAEIAGTAKDGGPAVASVKLVRGWSVVVPPPTGRATFGA